VNLGAVRIGVPFREEARPGETIPHVQRWMTGPRRRVHQFMMFIMLRIVIVWAEK
jgi:hypothetical protein